MDPDKMWGSVCLSACTLGWLVSVEINKRANNTLNRGAVKRWVIIPFMFSGLSI